MDFSNCAVLCVGDVMLDRFVDGEIDRISPEAPVPVMRLTGTREMLGGAGNVANNIAALGGRAVLVGLLGNDAAGAAVRTLVERRRPNVEPRFVESNHRPTVCKSRFVASRQQIVRTDDESRLPLQEDEEVGLISVIERSIRDTQAVVLSDYGKGVLSSRLVARVVTAARQAGIHIFVDPKSDDFSRYSGATCITPNLKELAAASRMPIAHRSEIIDAAFKVMADAGAAAILVTLSEKGMLLVEAGGAAHDVPARAREVFDVSGAGDTVIAAMSLAHASGRSLIQSMHIANAAAGVVVSKLGTATADIEEVLHEFQAHEHGDSYGGQPVIMTLQRVASLVERWKQQGLTVGFTNGCFDILHSGHVALLAASRLQCDRIVVALNSDASVRRLKGPTRPINSLEKRARVISAIRHVDCVVAFEESTPVEIIRRLVPHVLIKGADYSEDAVVGAGIVKAAGGRVYLAPLTEGQSTSGIVRKIHQTQEAMG
jgi:D-beta-D-heptose 7-phosphate kinase / D-beta-D-heptose 1-phosphate adenosyltransferase